MFSGDLKSFQWSITLKWLKIFLGGANHKFVKHVGEFESFMVFTLYFAAFLLHSFNMGYFMRYRGCFIELKVH